MSQSKSTTTAAASARRVYALLPALAAAFLGMFLLWGVGFAGPAVIHNAAHDARHSAAFPCH
jgi:cobalt transporter subunit CbtB